MSQTYKPKSLKRKRKHGFKKRSQTKDGRTVMQRRRR
ncbi:MAG TPA: 50S ribosomal protein L34, partial [Patescibacteria group bacterium]